MTIGAAFNLKSRASVDELYSDPSSGFMPVLVETYFSGSDAPIASMEALWPPSFFTHACSCDNNAVSKRFIDLNFAPSEWYGDVETAVEVLRRRRVQQASQAASNSNASATRKPKRKKIQIFGFPCTPHSTLNSRRFKQDGGFQASSADGFWTASQIIDEGDPDIAVLENVLGVKCCGPEEQQASLDLTDEELKRNKHYVLFRHCFGAQLPRKRRRYWWVLLKRRLANSPIGKSMLAKVHVLLERFEEACGDRGVVDNFLLPNDCDVVLKALMSYKPTQERYIQFHKAMDASTQRKHDQIRTLLGIAPFHSVEGRAFSESLSPAAKQAHCARERDMLDIWSLIQGLSHDQFHAARRRVKEAKKDWPKLANLPIGAHNPGKRMFIEVNGSAERWPFHAELSTMTRGSKTFDSQLGRIHVGAEYLACNGWSVCPDLNISGLSEAHVRMLMGQSMELPSVARILATYLPVLCPEISGESES